LQFPLGHPAVANVIPGSRSRAEVLANADLMAEPIPEALWADLKAEKLLRPDAPTPA
jgi:D-threo-aldose 1-dehydrogenase